MKKLLAALAVGTLALDRLFQVVQTVPMMTRLP